MSEQVKFGWASSRNISFYGEDESGYDSDEWNEMTVEQQSVAMTEFLFELVDVWVVE